MPLARLYEERRLAAEALATWEESFTADPSLEAGYQILRRNPPEDGAVVERQMRDLFPADALEAADALIQKGSTRPKAGTRHLAICGVSYSGSTMLGHFLDSFDGFHDIGESHWLIHQKEARDGQRQIDFFAAAKPTSVNYCRQCGQDCPVLSKAFRIELQLDRCSWYSRLAAHVGAAVLVSSDKNFAKYAMLDPRLRFDAIILFKSPLQAWQSFKKRLPTDDAAALSETFERFIQNWVREYDAALRMNNDGQKLFLHFDNLANAPGQTVARLLQILDLPAQDLDLEATMKGSHVIGGNDRFVGTLRKTEKIELRGHDQVTLKDDEVHRLKADPEMSSLFDELLARSDRQFGPS